MLREGYRSRHASNFVDHLTRLCRSGSWCLLYHSVRYNRWRRSVIETVGVIAFTLPSWRRTRTGGSPSWNTNERVLVTEGIYAFERIGTKANKSENRPDVDNAGEWTFASLSIQKSIARSRTCTFQQRIPCYLLSESIGKYHFHVKNIENIKNIDKNTCETM